MARRKAYGVVRNHGVAMQEIIAWAKIDPMTTPLELGVLEEMRDRLFAHAKNGAIVRIRIKNQGSRHLIVGGICNDPANEWTEEEKNTLRTCFSEKMTLEQTQERLPERTVLAIQTMKRKMGISGRWRDPRYWSEEDMETVRSMARKGYGCDQIAPLVGRSPKSVFDFAKRMNITVKPKMRRQRRPNEEYDPITGERPQQSAREGTREGVLAIMRRRRIERDGKDEQRNLGGPDRARLVASRFAKQRLETMDHDAAD
jgi:hypothetical protein